MYIINFCEYVYVIKFIEYLFGIILRYYNKYILIFWKLDLEFFVVFLLKWWCKFLFLN